MTAPIHEVDSVDDLSARLRDPTTSRVRLAGAGTRLPRLPDPGADVSVVSTRRLHRIQRLEPEDLTCSVEAGIPLDTLVAALAEHGMELPGLTSLLERCSFAAEAETPLHGTIGGAFAAGLVTPAAPGAWTPRNTMLGFDGVLADGTRFKAGARVVKNVAGFDLNKLFVGSRGRLFAVSVVHLKLRARPPARARLHRTDLDPEAAHRTLAAVRREASGIESILIERSTANAPCRLIVSVAGRPGMIDAIRARHALEPVTAEPPVRPWPDELVCGVSRPSQLEALLAATPGPVAVDGSGGFVAGFGAPDETDVFLAATSPEANDGSADRRFDSVRAERLGPGPRPRRTTPIDAVQDALTKRLRLTLDPQQRLA